MGFLLYQGQQFEFEDHTLAHLHAVIMYKLRRTECFAVSWQVAHAEGEGRTSIWLHPGSDLTFHFTASQVPALNREWLETLQSAANSPSGILLEEDTAEPTFADGSMGS